MSPLGLLSPLFWYYTFHTVCWSFYVAQLCYSRILNLGSVTPGGHRWTPTEMVNKILWTRAFIYEIVFSVHWLEKKKKKKIHKLKVASYILFRELTEYYSLRNRLSDSPEILFQKGKGGARIYRSFCWKQINVYLNIKRVQLITKKDILS